MGQVVGQSDRTAARPNGEGFDTRHLVGTVMNTLFDTGEMRLDPSVPGEILRIVNADQTIRPLHG